MEAGQRIALQQSWGNNLSKKKVLNNNFKVNLWPGNQHLGNYKSLAAHSYSCINLNVLVFKQLKYFKRAFGLK